MTQFINWDNVFANLETFKNNKPFPFGFVENVFESDFYNMLHETYPKVDSSWSRPTSIGRTNAKRNFGSHDPKKDKFPPDQEDKTLSKTWNDFFHYLYTDEFMDNMSKYTGIKLTKLNHFHFIYRQKGDFDMPHTHHLNMDPKDYDYKVTIVAYFAKGWKKGQPGGTYISSEEDESTIVFEPYNLDNSWVCFAETPKSYHGSRYITHNTPRPSIQFTLF
jgi:hypothetical protein